LQQKFLASGYVDELEHDRYHVLVRDWRNEVELFRENNVALQTELTKLASEYDKLIGAMQVDFRGESYTLQQMVRFGEENDQQTRREAWQLATARRLEDQANIDAIFQQMLDLRGQMETNAQMDNFRQWSWKAMGRFDYQPEQCLAFADAIEEICVPQVKRLDIQRRAALGLERLRPWDLAGDVKGREPLRPFDADDVGELVSKCGQIFGRVQSSLADGYSQLQFGHNFDLDSRKGKRAGGFQASLEECAEPFIFMNAAGLQHDVHTMLHEAGHAFHYMWARHESLVFQRHAPI
jgi:oligoendopeptidase F